MEEQFTAVDPPGDMLISEIAPFNLGILNEGLSSFQELLANPSLTKLEIKSHLAVFVKDVVRSSFAWSHAPQLLSILRWGVDKRRLQAESSSVNAHKNIVELIVQELYGKIDIKTLSKIKINPEIFDSTIEMLEDLHK